MSTSHSDMDGLAGAFLGIATIVVGLRFVARRLQHAQMAADDWMMIPSYLIFVGLMAAALYGTHHHSLGYSTPELQGVQTEPKVSVGDNRAVDTFAAAFFGSIKISALFFFRRVFCVRGHTDWFKISIWVLIVLTAIWSVIYILMPVFQCGTTISNAWGSTTERAKHCQLSNPYLESQSVTDAVFDLVLVVLPLPKIWSLKTSVKRRVAVTFVFLTALVSLAASIAKAVIVFQVSNHKISGDIQLSTTQAYWMWLLEAGFAMLAVNLPTLIWLRQAKAPEKMLQSVRSFLSVGSASRSAKSGHESTARDGSGKGTAAAPKAFAGSNVELGLIPKDGTDYKTVIESTTGEGHQQGRFHDGIHATNGMSQEVETV